VALDRLLRLRLPAYDPALHLGGAVYLFVRGLRPGWTEPGGAPCGMVLQRAPAALVRRLSTLLDGHEVSA
jgi:exodeoxyribonuclease V beta subunit